MDDRIWVGDVFEAMEDYVVDEPPGSMADLEDYLRGYGLVD